jgi:hypothetical protein
MKDGLEMFVSINTNSEKNKAREKFGKGKETFSITVLTGMCTIFRQDINSLTCVEDFFFLPGKQGVLDLQHCLGPPHYSVTHETVCAMKMSAQFWHTLSLPLCIHLQNPSPQQRISQAGCICTKPPEEVVLPPCEARVLQESHHLLSYLLYFLTTG